jgi:hypothetical protein
VLIHDANKWFVKAQSRWYDHMGDAMTDEAFAILSVLWFPANQAQAMLMLAQDVALGPSNRVLGQATQCDTGARIRGEREGKSNHLVTEY